MFGVGFRPVGLKTEVKFDMWNTSLCIWEWLCRLRLLGLEGGSR